MGDLAGKRVFVRVDFNVPLEGGRVTDDTRIVEALPTVRELRERKARVILASHCGRPKGRRDPRYSLRPVAEHLVELLGKAARFAPDCVGPEAEKVVAQLNNGEVCLLENVRFHPGETENDDEFADGLARLGQVFVGDAFGTAHRAHASVVGAAERMEEKAAGRLMAREVEALGRLLESPRRPFVALLGGAKIGGKLDTIDNLIPRVEKLLVGGGIANTFLAARGVEMGESLVDRDRVALAGELLEKAEAAGVTVVLPEDLVVAAEIARDAEHETVGVDAGVPSGTMALDIGPTSRRRFSEAMSGARTLFWNGPMGVFETPPFDAGTEEVARALVDMEAYTVIGGGETVAAAARAGVTRQIDHVSTGGGASLEFLAGKTLPGIAVLEKEETS
ncbi:MAG: phosphoglycerate kinase [Acidobacteriota bacterium]